MNPRSVRTKVALGTVSGISGEHKWHGSDIPDGWFRVEVNEAFHPNTPLMVENRAAEQEKIRDVVGGNVIWDQKYMKAVP